MANIINLVYVPCENQAGDTVNVPNSGLLFRDMRAQAFPYREASSGSARPTTGQAWPRSATQQ